MEPYMHVVQYYETDKMGITHHSNYVRWMEEARIDFLNKIGCPFDKLEKLGIISPVTGVECRYKVPTTFAERIRIEVTTEEFRGVRLKLLYRMYNAEDKLVCEGRSEHCFVNADGRPIRLAREFPEVYEAIMGTIPAEEKTE